MAQWKDSITNNPLPYNPSGMDFELSPTDNSLFIDQLTTVAYIKCNSLTSEPKVVLPFSFIFGSLMFVANKGTTAFTLSSAAGSSIVSVPAGTFWVVSNTLSGFNYAPLNIAVNYAVSPSVIAGAGLKANTSNTLLNVQGDVIWVDTPQYTSSVYQLPSLVSGDTFIGINQGGDWLLPAAGVDQIGMTFNLKNSSPQAITVKCPLSGAYALDFTGMEIDPLVNQSVILMPDDSLVLIYAGINLQFNSKAMYYILSHDTPDSNLLTESVVNTPITPSSPIQLMPYVYLKDSISFQDVDSVNDSSGDFIFTIPKPVPHVYFLSSNLRGSSYTITIKFAGGGQGKQVTLSPTHPFIALTVTSAGLVAVAN